MIMTALEADDAIDLSRDVQVGSLTHFHQRFGHLSHDRIERIARNPESDAAPATIRHYPNLFGMLSESGMAIQSHDLKNNKYQSKFDVPFGRIAYKHSTSPGGSNLRYYPYALRKASSDGDGHAVESPAEDAAADLVKGVFRDKAKVAQRATPM